MADRIFLDANVLFSAAYREGSTLQRLWSVPGVSMVTSSYAAHEAMRNAVDDDHLRRLLALLATTEVMIDGVETQSSTLFIQTNLVLPEKDWPILLAALDAGATHLLTGDKQHFGHLFDTSVQGLRIQTPGAYLLGREAGA